MSKDEKEDITNRDKDLPSTSDVVEAVKDDNTENNDKDLFNYTPAYPLTPEDIPNPNSSNSMFPLSLDVDELSQTLREQQFAPDFPEPYNTSTFSMPIDTSPHSTQRDQEQSFSTFEGEKEEDLLRDLTSPNSDEQCAAKGFKKRIQSLPNQTTLGKEQPSEFERIKRRYHKPKEYDSMVLKFQANKKKDKK